MKGPLKWIAGIVGAIVLLVVAAAIILPLVIDPNEYKPEIIAQVKERTGRDLRIDGDIELTVFPWIGVKVGEVALSNAPGFDDPVFAKTDDLSIRVKLLPLLTGRLEMDTVTIHGLALNLARDAQGRGNWEDLAAAGGDAGGSGGSSGGSSGGPSGAGEAAVLAIGGLDIDDANLSWDDASTGQRFAIKDLDLKTGAITAGEPVDLLLEMEVEVGEPEIEGTITAGGRIDYDQVRRLVRVEGLEVEGKFSGDPLPGGRARIALAANLEHDAAGQSLLVEQLRLEAEDLTMTGQMRVEELATTPVLDGTIKVDEFDPKKLLAVFSEEGIETRDPEALTRLSMQAAVGGNPNKLSINPLTIKLDESTLTGQVSVPDLAAQALRFELALDAIDVDRYLPPQKEGEAGGEGAGSGTSQAGTPGAAATGGAGEVPNEALRKLDLDGEMKIARLKASNLNLSAVVVRIKGKDGLIRLNPFDANLYEGTYRGDITLDARGQSLRTSVDENLTAVLAGPLLKDLQGRERLTGKADFNVAMSGTGASADEIKRTLNGSGSFAFTDGAINGVNVARMIREAYAKIKGQKLPPEDVEQKTDFSELHGSVRVNDGVATNDDFTMRTPLLRINGKGTANLPAETVDYRVTATLVSTLKGQGGEDLEELVGVPIPIRVTGAAADPQYALDTEALAQALAKSKIEDVLEDKVGDDKVKGLLKGLLK